MHRVFWKQIFSVFEKICKFHRAWKIENLRPRFFVHINACSCARRVLCYFIYIKIAYVYVYKESVHVIVVFINVHNLYLTQNIVLSSLLTYFDKILHDSIRQLVNNLYNILKYFVDTRIYSSYTHFFISNPFFNSATVLLNFFLKYCLNVA